VNMTNLTNFLATINSANPKIAKILSYFSTDNMAKGIPFIGITQNGPQFKYQTGYPNSIDVLFGQFYSSFPNMQWKQSAANNTIESGNNIAVEMTMSGQQNLAWFQAVNYSDPLSQINQATIDNLGAYNQVSVPACSVYTFDSSHKIQQIAIYMDRYSIMDQLAPKGWKQALLPQNRRAYH
jgi:hypothetical protein